MTLYRNAEPIVNKRGPLDGFIFIKKQTVLEHRQYLINKGMDYYAYGTMSEFPYTVKEISGVEIEKEDSRKNHLLIEEMPKFFYSSSGELIKTVNFIGLAIKELVIEEVKIVGGVSETLELNYSNKEAVELLIGIELLICFKEDLILIDT